jgi:hypothetical protein
MDLPLTPKILVPFIFTVGVICLSQFVIPLDKIKVFISFMILIPIHLMYQNYLMPILFVIVLLILSAVALVFDDPVTADQVATYSFWLLVVGLVLHCVKYFRFERLEDKRELIQDHNV